MSHRYWIPILLLTSIPTWWLLRETPEAEVSIAHERLETLLTKTEDDSVAAATLNARSLQLLFAETCEVLGDAGVFAGTYTPEAIASTAFQVRALFEQIDLSFGELSVVFPAKDEAVVSFSATLVTSGPAAGAEAVSEIRDVVSRLHRSDGDWVFTSFHLSEAE